MHYRQTFLAFRQLLSRIRDVMAGAGDPETRLGRIVGIIAENMGAEVCSIYLRRAGEVLELFATRGLRQSAVHYTRLRIGEGLIGEIAATGRPLALAEAQHHPSFVFRPETGEEIYQSLMGVPIIGRGRVLGVLAVQNQDRRQYSDDEIEVLQTVAMVLAELVASGELVSRAELAPTEGIAVTPLRLEGVSLNAGLAIGTAVQHRPHITIRRIVADDSRIEHERLGKAVTDMHGSLDGILSHTEPARGHEYRDVLETYRMIAADVGWLRRIGDAIDSGLTAEAAVQKVANEIRARFHQVSDPVLRERVHDFEDLSNRLLQHLLGSLAENHELPEGVDAILIARNMGPAELLDYQPGRLKGLILEEGSFTAHVAIVARALDLPVLGQVRRALSRIETGDAVILDSQHAQAFVRPSDHIRQAFVANLELRNRQQAAYVAERDKPAVTRDGVRVQLNINAGLLVDLPHMAEFGADGVGLYRTEVPFMARTDLPDVESQRLLYARVLEYAAGKPVVFRTLDIGGDKVLQHWEHVVEENPAMGWRAIRVGLDRPALLRQQLRAMIRAAAGMDLRVMFPMVTDVAEFRFARRLFDQEIHRESRLGGPLPRTARVGAMLEVPALVLQLDALLAEADFISVGTNDLAQFLFASDRGSARTADRYDCLSPVFLDLLTDILRRCRRAGVSVSLCGEMAGRPVDAMALIGLGFRDLSLPPFAVGPVRTMVRSLTLGQLEAFMHDVHATRSSSVRGKLVAFARDHAITI
ncbi:MAG: phosphoenolpyruvate--protein phosphotransferase [Rhodospirillales bacterium]|nr:MAG: phosphoenolpyruvate--protein phosphotransferase [Rhodospirillales bacterium]